MPWFSTGRFPPKRRPGTAFLVPGLAGRLKALRESRGLECVQLAGLAGCTAPTIRKIERGTYPVCPELLARLALALNVSALYLSLGKECPHV